MKYRLKEYKDGYGVSVWRVQQRHKWWPFWWSNSSYFCSPWSYSYYEYRDRQKAITAMSKMASDDDARRKERQRKAV